MLDSYRTRFLVENNFTNRKNITDVGKTNTFHAILEYINYSCSIQNHENEIHTCILVI